MIISWLSCPSRLVSKIKLSTLIIKRVGFSVLFLNFCESSLMCFDLFIDRICGLKDEFELFNELFSWQRVILDFLELSKNEFTFSNVFFKKKKKIKNGQKERKKKILKGCQDMSRFVERCFWDVHPYLGKEMCQHYFYKSFYYGSCFPFRMISQKIDRNLFLRVGLKL